METAIDHGSPFTWCDESLEDLSQPNRIKQIKEDRKENKVTETKRKINPLRPDQGQ